MVNHLNDTYKWQEMPEYKCEECEHGMIYWWGKFDQDENLVDMSDRECNSCDNVNGS